MRMVLTAALGFALLTMSSAAGASRENPRDPSPVLRGDWLLLQLVPSPGVALGASGPAATLRWHVTPLLYSFGTDRRLNRFRWFIAEPLYRHSGSVELFADPFYIGRDRPARDRWGLSTGARAHFPWLERGDALSYSVGASMLLLHEGFQPSFEAGLSTLFGVLGVFVHVAPWFDDGYAELSLRVRWF
jgi:hypothetical protein